jgi:hypothetical protein
MRCVFCEVGTVVLNFVKFLAGTDVFTVMKIDVEVFWVVTPYSNEVGYQRFSDLHACTFMWKPQPNRPRHEFIIS